MMNSALISSVSWHVGTCGISDSDWNGNFYPKGLRPIDWLAHYAMRFNAIEMNTTYHRIPSKSSVRRWEKVTPSDFHFCVKFLREITHGPPHRLLEADTLEITKRFFDVVQELGQKLKVVLIQFPPRFSAVHWSALLRFLDRISCPVRLALEVRHNSWWNSETSRALRERDIGWVTADLGRDPRVAQVPTQEQLGAFGLRRIISTTDFLYARWLGKHGQFPIHVEEYFNSTPRVNWWVERLTHGLESHPNIRHVYAFFDNDFSGHAPTAARRFADKVNLPRFFETPSTLKQPSLYPLRSDSFMQ